MPSIERDTGMHAPQSSDSNHTEIDLAQLFEQCWASRRSIALITALGTGAALAYALLATPIYQVDVLLRPVQTRALEALNIKGLYSITPKQALDRVSNELTAYSGRRTYFEAHPEQFEQLEFGELSPERAFWRFSLDAFSIEFADKKEKTPRTEALVRFSMQSPKGMDGVAILNGLLSATLEREHRQIQEDVQARIDNRLQVLERDIAAMQASYATAKRSRIATLMEADAIRRANLQDELKALRGRLRLVRDSRIQQLDEAIGIASQLGIRKPTTPGVLGEDGRDSSRSLFRTEVNNQQIPLYFMGVDALKAERGILLRRKTDDFTSPRIAVIQQELKQLEHNREIQYLQAREDEERFYENLAALRGEQARLLRLNIGETNIQLVRVDQEAATPLKPVRPKRALLVALGVLGGVLLGSLLVLLRELPRRHRGEPRISCPARMRLARQATERTFPS
ncbi:Wzz/FepE/Etk N-terminal domain-containing protein [Pseudomonas aeruginosa]